MLSIRNIFKNQGSTFSKVITFQYRRFRISRYFTSDPNEKAIKALHKFKLQQARMQSDDGVPVYLKRGRRDKIVFNVSLGLSILNAVIVGDMMYQLRKKF